jgi:transposase
MVRDLYTLKEAAEYLGVDENTVKSWLCGRRGAKNGKRYLTPDVTVGRSYLFSRATLSKIKREREAAAPQHTQMV